ncbi:uL23 family ribosomal protein [Lacunimicrobium album]|jgi:Ribosomal protein L23
MATPEQTETKPKGLNLAPHQVLIRPIITEKTTHLSESRNAYTFEVHQQADKTQIKDAVQAMWNVKVVAVNTQNRVGKTRRFKLTKGVTKNWKKAIVTLHSDDSISFF